MHELAVTQGILKICEDEKREHNFKRIKEIRIKVGELTGLVPSCIDYYFNIVSNGTASEGAKIIVEKLPINIICLECNFIGEIEKGQYGCPKCNSYRIKITNGKEFYIDSLEVE